MPSDRAPEPIADAPFGGARAPWRDIHMAFRVDSLAHICAAYGAAAAEAALVKARGRIGNCLGRAGQACIASDGVIEAVLWDHDMLGGVAADAQGCGRFVQLLCALMTTIPMQCGADVLHLSVSGAFSAPRRARGDDDGGVGSPKAARAALARQGFAGPAARAGACWARAYRADMALAAGLLLALAQKRVRFRWRPVVSAHAPQSVLYYEALPEIARPGGGYEAASRLRPALARLGLTWALDQYVLTQVAGELAASQGVEIGVDFATVSAPTEFWWTDMSARLARGGRAARLTLQIQPGHAGSSCRDAGAFAARLAQFGCRIALDDFRADAPTPLLGLRPDVIKVAAGSSDPAGPSASEREAFGRDLAHASRLAPILVAKGVDRPAQARLARDHAAPWRQGELIAPATFKRTWRVAA